jgi:hypothetical protein
MERIEIRSTEKRIEIRSTEKRIEIRSTKKRFEIRSTEKDGRHGQNPSAHDALVARRTNQLAVEGTSATSWKIWFG